MKRADIISKIGRKYLKSVPQGHIFEGINLLIR